MITLLRRLFSKQGGVYTENVYATSYTKNCLLVYLTNPFIHPKNVFSHQNQFQVVEISKVYRDLGYNVDVVDYNHSTRIDFGKKFDVVFDLYPRDSNIYDGFLKNEAKKIGYITGSNISFSNVAEEQRLKDLFKRKGVVLLPRRRLEPFSKTAIESCDAIIFMGNTLNLQTYQDFDFKNVHLINNTGYPFLSKIDGSKRRPNNFLFLGGAGQVHKGLDLLLEAFRNLPELNFYVCSPCESEPDFCDVYHTELYETPNIFLKGYVDISKNEFSEILEACSFIMLPTCSEGMAGSVLTGMSAGLIPVVSDRAGFDGDEVILLDNCDIPTISKTVSELSKKPMDWIKERSEQTMYIANTKYHPDTYSQTLKHILMEELWK